jgi:hypothetical protein
MVLGVKNKILYFSFRNNNVIIFASQFCEMKNKIFYFWH